MWEKGKNLVYLYVKLSILSIEGARLIFINTTNVIYNPDDPVDKSTESLGRL